MNTQPRAVVFDLGKVLLDFDYGIAARTVGRACTRSLAEVQQLLDQSPLLFDLECNRVSVDAFFREVQKMSGYQGTQEEFCRAFGDIFTAIPIMVDFHSLLRTRGIRVYLFSNTNYLAVDHIRRRFPFFHEFDGQVLSCDHGFMKPDPRLYEVVEQMTGLSGPDLLYIDDRDENIATARQRGWQTIWHQTPEETVTTARARLNL